MLFNTSHENVLLKLHHPIKVKIPLFAGKIRVIPLPVNEDGLLKFKVKHDDHLVAYIWVDQHGHVVEIKNYHDHLFASTNNLSFDMDSQPIGDEVQPTFDILLPCVFICEKHRTWEPKHENPI
jgi:hypothetical protein